MGKYKKGEAAKGSLKHIQRLINLYPHLLNVPLAKICGIETASIMWRSPLQPDFCEYSDSDFLNVIDCAYLSKDLSRFWPRGGPQWDALGKAKDGQLFMVEAKAHIDEMVTPGSGASALSLAKIRYSLQKIKSYLKIKDPQPWHKTFYQYTNRLAHLFFLRVMYKKPAFLVFLYFMNDPDYEDSPKSEAEWAAAIRVAETYLSLRRHKLRKYIIHIFIDVNELSNQI